MCDGTSRSAARPNFTCAHSRSCLVGLLALLALSATVFAGTEPTNVDTKTTVDPAVEKLLSRFKPQKDGDVDNPYRPMTYENGKIVGIHLNSGNMMDTMHDADIAAACKIEGLRELTIRLGMHVSPDGLVPLKELKNLKKLDLRYNSTGITDRELGFIQPLTQLESLDLWTCAVTDQGVEQLARLRNLTFLRLASTKVTNAGCPVIAQLSDLRRLSLENTDVTGKGVACLEALPHLEELRLGGKKIADDACPEIAKLKRLKSLTLYYCHITDAGIQHLSSLNELEYLDLTGTQITKKSLIYLKNLPKLRSVRLFEALPADDAYEFTSWLKERAKTLETAPSEAATKKTSG